MYKTNIIYSIKYLSCLLHQINIKLLSIKQQYLFTNIPKSNYYSSNNQKLSSIHKQRNLQQIYSIKKLKNQYIQISAIFLKSRCHNKANLAKMLNDILSSSISQNSIKKNGIIVYQLRKSKKIKKNQVEFISLNLQGYLTIEYLRVQTSHHYTYKLEVSIQFQKIIKLKSNIE